MSKKRLFHGMKRSLALFLALALALAFVPVVTPTALAATNRGWSNSVVLYSNDNSTGHSTNDAKISFDNSTGKVSGTRQVEYSANSVFGSNVSKIVITAVNQTAGIVPWYGTTNMLGFNVSVPNDNTWLRSATRKMATNAAGISTATSLDSTIAGTTYEGTAVNYDFTDPMPATDFTKGGIIHLYVRPNEARYYEYTLTWADAQSSGTEYTETIAFDLTDANITFEAPTAPISPTAGKATSGTDVELKLDLTATEDANPAVVGTWDGYDKNADVAYEVYVMTGAASDLTFKLINATPSSLPVNTAYQVATETSLGAFGSPTVAEGPKGDVKITGLNDRDVILFYTDASNYIKVRVCAVSQMTVNSGANGSVVSDFSAVANATSAENSSGDKTVTVNASGSESWLRDLNDKVTFTVAPKDSDVHEIESFKITTTADEAIKVGNQAAAMQGTATSGSYTYDLTDQAIAGAVDVTFVKYVKYTIDATFKTKVDTSPFATVTSLPELTAALSGGKTDITVTDGFSLDSTSDIEIPSGTTLTIANGETLTIPTGAILTIYGELDLNDDAKVSIAGALQFAYNASISAGDDVTLELDGGVIKFVPDRLIRMTFAITGDDITAIFKQSLAIISATPLGGIVDIEVGQGVALDVNVTVPAYVTIDVDGELYVNAGFTLTLQEDATLVLNSGATSVIEGTLVVDDGAEVTVEGNLTVDGVLTVDGTINIGNGVTVNLSGATTVTGTGDIVLAPGASLIPDASDSLSVKDSNGEPLSPGPDGNYSVDDYAIDINPFIGGLGVTFEIEVSGGVNSSDLYLIVQSTVEDDAVSLVMIAVGAYNAVNSYSTYVSYNDADLVDVWLVDGSSGSVVSGSAVPDWTASETGAYLKTANYTAHVTP